MDQKTVKFDDNVKPPYYGKIKSPNRIKYSKDTWYMIINNGEKDGPYTTEDMRGFFEANMFENDTLCSNDGIDGNYYKLELIFYPNIIDAFLPNEYNPLVKLEHRTAAASAEILRLAEKHECNQTVNGVVINQLPNTDTHPVEGDDELEWFLHYGNPKWVNQNGEIIKFSKSVRRDFVMIGDIVTMFEFKKLDPMWFSHKGDGILRIKECAINRTPTTVCVKEMMIFALHGLVYKLYPVVNGSKRYLIMCIGPEVVEVILFARTETLNEVSNRPIASYENLLNMRYRSVSDLLVFNDENYKKVHIFSENETYRPSILRVVEHSDSIVAMLINGKYWILRNWEDNRQIQIRFTSDGYICENDENIGTWSIQQEGSFALYQDMRDWSTIYRQKVRRRVSLNMVGGVKYNMYILKDMTNGLIYMHEELAYFQIIGGKVTMADISGRKAREAVRIV